MALDAVDISDNGLDVGDLVTLRAEVLGDAGGTNQVYLRFLRPAADDEGAVDTVRTGAEQTDVAPVFDAALILRD